jgi:1-acyl-sn-glycerol-3-phosphate acyltransferase
MFYRLYRALARLTLRLFFRQIDVEGRRNIPALGPALFVPNHTNALVDPLVLLISMRRRLTVTAKNVLARNPLLGWLMAALGVVTFHRREDVGKGADPRQNRRSLERCREILSHGGAICLFPEGISHSDPKLRAFHVGAARIAIDFVRLDGNPGRLKIVPTGLLYTEKDQFRSAVWLRFEKPIDVERYLAEHPEADAKTLTEEIRQRVESLTLNYQTRRESLILTWAADILATQGAMPAPLGRPEQSSADWFRLLGRLLAGYRTLLQDHRPEIDHLSMRIRRYRSDLKRRGIEPSEVYLPLSFWRALLFVVRELELIIVGFPLALFGAVNHFLPYIIVKSIARKLSTDKDHWASNVVYPSLAVFPLFYAIQLLAAWLLLPAFWAILYTVALPYTGYYAVLYGDRWQRALRRARTFIYFFLNRDRQQELSREGQEIIRDIRSLGERLPGIQPASNAQGGSPREFLARIASDFESQLQSDSETLRQIIASLDNMEIEVEQTRPTAGAKSRGYFAPDEDDRLRQLLLSYRNHRLALYQMIDRYSLPEPSASWPDQIRAFMLGFAAATTLYAKSLRLIEAYEQEPLVRKKFNEPDAKFGMPAGFFDSIEGNYTSLFNYRLLMRARRRWLQECGAVRRVGLEFDPTCRWLCEVITREQAVLRPAFWKLLRRRLRYDWRAIGKSVLKPIHGTRYGLQALIGKTIDHARITRHYRPAIEASTLDRLRPLLQPGDIFLVRCENKITATLLPGFWVHAALYLGDRSDLRQLGLAEHPNARGIWQQIPEESRWGFVLQAISPRVTITRLEECLQVDHLVVLRSQISDTVRREVLTEAFGHLGKPYDFQFDFNVTTRLVCTELIYRCIHNRCGISFSLTKRLGRFTLSCDDMIAWFLDAVEHSSAATPAPLNLVALVLQATDGRAHFVPTDQTLLTLRAIQKGLRPSSALAPLGTSIQPLQLEGQVP